MRLLLLPVAIAAAVAISGPVFAQDSGQDASGASAAGSQAVGLLAASGVKTAVGASALPVSVAAVGVSGAGAVSTAAGHVGAASGADLSQAAGASANTALKVDDTVVISPDPAPKVPYKAQTADPRE
ncbi:hypothetical protein [Phenylobacterium sp.]|jgi:hypothetical protein|uniref:hypothetical protein n=1 Tax=Phenylobacterium sp. TaxID=1871053 RepID=UPI002F3EA47B